MDRENWIKDHLNIPYIDAEEFPDIELYMDQVTTFMEQHLDATKRYDEDKILTKTMINNYTKNRLLPPPNKKKYSKNHIFMLVFIYYMKNILNLSDIQSIMTPITEDFLSEEISSQGMAERLSLQEIYATIIDSLSEQQDTLENQILHMYRDATEVFEDAQLSQKEMDYLHDFSFICHLANDIYVKKHLLERFIDQRAKETGPADSNKKKKAKK